MVATERHQCSPTQFVWATVQRAPDAVALEIGDRRWTYERLWELAGRLAASLVGAHGRVPRRVGLLTGPSVLAYAGYLAILRLGATVVPLSQRYPPFRIHDICAAAAVEVVIVGDSMSECLGSPMAGPRRLVVADDCDRIGELSPGREALRDPAAEPDGIAYILFTSGSTGRPKGVPISNRQIVAHTRYGVGRYEIGPASKVSQTFDLAFDPSVFCMMTSWFGGATLVVAQADEVLDPAAFVNTHDVTHWFSVPSVISLSKRLRNLRPATMPGLAWSMFAGEQLTLAQALDWSRSAGNSVIDNLYGPTEMTVTCAGYRLSTRPGSWPDTSNRTVPIGTPYPHVEALLVDEHGSVSSHEGELCLRGVQRFDGYLDPEDNHRRFVRVERGRAVEVPAGDADAQAWYRTGDRVRREAGELVHIGRVDDQVKIAGYRVEPGEISAVLRRCPGVEEVVVVARLWAGSTQLCVVYQADGALDGALEALARSQLPAYMVPTRFLRVDAMPLGPNGKLDRTRLRHLLDDRPAVGPDP
jgi:amino acid adenylation domain-containing protein